MMGSTLVPDFLELLREYRSVAGGVLFFGSIPIGAAVLIYSERKSREGKNE